MGEQPDTSPRQDTAAVQKFFDQWHIYRQVVDHDYLSHRGAFEALGARLSARTTPFSFLDLGSGDASFTADLLAGAGVSRYEAVDLSPIALDLARGNTEKLACEKQFKVADFFSEIRDGGEIFDVIFIGFSLHHLPQADKREFFRDAAHRVSPGGSLIVFEPLFLPGESRPDYMRRWVADARERWTVISPEAMVLIEDHVTNNDYPETLPDYRAMASVAGFSPGEVLFQDPQRFYGLLAFDK